MKTLPILLLAISSMALAQQQNDYAKNAGKPVGVYVNEALNYRLDLDDIPYVYINFTKQVPDASFAGMRFNPGVVSAVIAEDAGIAFSPEQYAGLVRSAMTAKFASSDEVELSDYRDIGARNFGDNSVHQFALYGTVASEPIIYLVTTLVDRARAYQLLTIGTNQAEDVVIEQANAFAAGFSLIDKNAALVAAERVRAVDEYRSQTFDYRFRSKDKTWYSWTDLEENYAGADLGALSTEGFGTVVLPVCWSGPAPVENAVYSVMMRQFGESYPSDFIDSEEPVGKDSARGRRFGGREDHDDVNNDDYIWVV
jgi:hypothetical protein